VKSHLNPAASSQWVRSTRACGHGESEIATFFAVFPYGYGVANNVSGQGYDICWWAAGAAYSILCSAARLDGRTCGGGKIVANSNEFGHRTALDLCGDKRAQLGEMRRSPRCDLRLNISQARAQTRGRRDLS